MKDTKKPWDDTSGGHSVHLRKEDMLDLRTLFLIYVLPLFACVFSEPVLVDAKASYSVVTGSRMFKSEEAGEKIMRWRDG